MTHLLRLGLVAALLAPSAGAQSSDDRDCDRCKRDSAVRVTQKRRIEARDKTRRLTALAEELGALRDRLDDNGELSQTERRRLEARAMALKSEIAQMGVRLGIEAAARSLEHVEPAMTEARRAMAAAVSESHAVTAVAPAATRFAGWIGLTLDAPSAVQERGNDVYWRFLDLPRVVSVDPNSPADRAGIRRDDVLLAYDGKDVRREIAMNRLLRPGRLITVRVRRDDSAKDVVVRVAPAREMAAREWAPGVLVPVPRRPQISRRTPHEPLPPLPPPEPGAALVTPPSATPPPTPSISILRVPNGLAGAHMETITPGLADAIGVERGVLVLSVAHGLPAHESGLRDGDVIVAVNGRRVRAFRELTRAVANADERFAVLDVARKGKVRKVALRW